MTKKKILIVEDEQPVVDALKMKFEKEGFLVETAKNGEEGLIAVKNKPDLMLLDLIMPRMDGLTMLKKLRAEEGGETLPVIILTNLSDDEKISEALEEGSYSYLVKSDWKIEDVVKKVKERLNMT